MLNNELLKTNAASMKNQELNCDEKFVSTMSIDATKSSGVTGM